MFGSIMNRMFARNGQAGAASTPVAGRSSTAARGESSIGPVMQPPAAERFDVDAMLTRMAAEYGDEKLQWRTSIVDLMKLLNLDSTLAGRRSLAMELGYRGDLNDTAAMNMWLHKQVLRQLAENGGRVPGSLWNVV
jgi:hypothetical protein